MRMYSSQGMTNREAFSNDLMKSEIEAVKDAKTVRVEKFFNNKLADNQYTPTIFTLTLREKVRNYDPDIFESHPTGEKPIVLDLVGGERIEAGRFLKPQKGLTSRGDEYRMAWRLTSQDVHGNVVNDDNEVIDERIVHHPWVSIGTVLKLSADPLENNAIDPKEEDEILRYMALFNTKDILIEGIEFSIGNYPKLLLLKSFGRSIAEVKQEPVTLEELSRSLEVLEELRKLDGQSSVYQNILNHTNKLRERYMQSINSFSDLDSLYSQDYLLETLGENYQKRLYEIYAFATYMGNGLTKWKEDGFFVMMNSPFLGTPFTKEESDNILRFIVDNGIGFQIGVSPKGVEMVTNPIVAKRINELPKLPEDV